ncbi:acyl-CoA dehydrogenase family protein [Micromonospora auratinigra]|uniref:Acyl-[acyl-carrier-protein] dehydrogenase MbtN n=1 Tax=Micromonospora auratinigra TaxID=261654 RepID=A0A1A8Z4M7_9ACTN|nr:acyl-CoA dehydrogenase family protein [Micromonospora auratinigra]SBT38757.1 hypothetical protein GA0070611_0665 [Micromonospora auratinigra]
MSMLFDDGVVGEHVDDYRRTVRSVIERDIVPLVRPAADAGLFPREALSRLGAAGLIRQRWTDQAGDPGRAAILHEEMAAAGCAGVAVGVTLVMETVAGALLRFGHSPQLRKTLDGVLEGDLVGCFGASEVTGGSDLSGIRSSVRRERDGWRVRAEKKYLSLGRACDFALLLCRVEREERARTLQPLAIVMVPGESLRVVKPLHKAGAAALDTTWMACDTWVPDEAMLGRPGLGLVMASEALTYERVAVAAHCVGVGSRALTLAAAHLHRRTQFGQPLICHQALRLRLADLTSQLAVLRHAVCGAAAAASRSGGRTTVREAAALKVTAARLIERVTSESMHFFGGAGYLEDETPMAALWRDARLARIGAGTDEVLWEIVANGIVPDFRTYDTCVNLTENAAVTEELT